ncbi:Glutathione S-transferase U17 [Dichanthelium oligosanthes]|uniref:Glutathione S-transferase n=1 Tax=Dichanthelium oligosanthes TaxID=888268 RepID=A0A1E5VHY2_9POAL|nr:Glutathione S-transferase U17 [Dichanthelium oligosanthes]
MASAGGEKQAPAVRVLGLRASPFVIRVLIALKLKGVEYEFVEEVVSKKSELLLTSNPVHKKVPVLLHHGKPISESLNIIQYIDEVNPSYIPTCPNAFGPTLRRQDIGGIQVMRGVMEGNKDEAAGQMATALEHLESALALVESRHGKEHGYFGGDGIGYLDIVLGSYVGWFRAMEKITGNGILDEAKFPRLHSLS